MRRYIKLAIAVLVLLLFSGINAEAKKPTVTRHDAQYLDKAIKVNVQWQSTEPIVSIKVAAGKGEKVIKVDPYSNKRSPDGYHGEEDVVLESEPAATQTIIPYSIQLEDEDGQRSTLVTGQVKIPAAAAAATAVAATTTAAPQEDQWGKDKLPGASSTTATGGTAGSGDMIDKLRQVAQVVAGAPFLHDVTVNNPPGSNTVTFKTKATHSVGLGAVKFRVFSADNRQVDSQDIEAKGTVWEGTSKDFTLPAGKYFVIAQAVDAAGSTSPEKKANFTITGTAQVSLPQAQPQAEQPQPQTEQPQQPQQPQVEQPPVEAPPPAPVETPPPVPVETPQAEQPQQTLPSVSDPVIYFNGNIAGVQNRPQRETAFNVNAAHRVTFIYTYHYFNQGAKPGTIALRHSDGTVYGPWQAEGAIGQGGVQNAYWFIRPDVEIKPGHYTVIDSDPATWSHNAGSSGSGFVEIRGVKAGK
jgi:hypothetical protein